MPAKKASFLDDRKWFIVLTKNIWQPGKKRLTNSLLFARLIIGPLLLFPVLKVSLKGLIFKSIAIRVTVPRLISDSNALFFNIQHTITPSGLHVNPIVNLFLKTPCPIL